MEGQPNHTLAELGKEITGADTAVISDNLDTVARDTSNGGARNCSSGHSSSASNTTTHRRQP